MPAAVLIPLITTVLGSVIQGVMSKGQGGGAQQMPAPAPAPQVANAPPQDLTQFNHPQSVGAAPNFLQLSSGMSPIQQRTAIATGAVSGPNASAFRDPTVSQYYKNLVLNSMTDQNGNPIQGANPTPIETQYLQQLGQQPQQDTTNSFLSAVSRL